MERRVKCQICEIRIATIACKKCGKNICDICFYPSKGICVSCIRGIS